MFYWPHTNLIRIIARAKLSGFGEHWGVQLSDGRVVHRTQNGIELVSFNDFAQRRIVREVRQARTEEYWNIMARVDAALYQPDQYRLLDNNCEHFATWLLGEKPESPQVNGIALVGLALLAVKLIEA